MKFGTTLLIFVTLIVFSTSATYRDYLQKQVIVPLPYYPAQCKFGGSENDLNFNRPQNAASFYCVSSKEGEKNRSLAYGSIENNPRHGLMKVPEPMGMASDLAMINKEPDQVNPFLDSSINLFSAVWGMPVLVTEKNPNVICYIDTILSTTYESLLVSEPLNDAEGALSSGIIGLTLGSTGTVENSKNFYIFAAVKDTNDLWGYGTAGGIAVVKYDKKEEEIITKNAEGKEKKEKKIDRFFNILDATTGVSFGNKAIPLDWLALSINGGTFSTNPKIVDVFWNPYLERLFVALQVKNSLECADDQGSRALMVGRIDSRERFKFDIIMADHLCQGTDKIIGACGKDVSTSLHKVRTLCTSTGYIYLILVGGVGEPHETDKEVYALPLADHLIDSQGMHTLSEIMENSLHGMIASKNSTYTNSLRPTAYGFKLSGRSLSDVACSDQVPTKNDKETQVGAGKEVPSTITDIIVLGDAVYVTCAQPGSGQQPGIFHSQAILDAKGKIAAWTPWQRIAGIQEGVATAMISPEQYFVTYLKSDKPEIVCQITQNISPNKEREHDEMAKGDLSDLLNEQFNRKDGGIYGLSDFSVTSPLCGTTDSVSLLVASGYKKIVLIESGNKNDEGYYTAYKEGFTTNIFYNKDGSIMPLTEYNDETKPGVIVVEGGVLNEIGAITDSVVVNDGLQAWLVVSGMRGVAILAADDGSGISCDTGIMSHFAGIKKPLSFKKLGTWNYVKKIVADERFLYLLVKNSVERIAINQSIICESSFQKGSFVAQINPMEGAFFDLAVSGPLAIIASSKGVFVNYSGTDCRFDTNESMQWSLISLPYAKGAAYKLFVVSSTGQKNGFGHTGQVYVSNGSLLENMSRVYRLYVHDVFKDGVTHQSVQLVEDFLYPKRGNAPLLTLGNFRDHFATDGVHYFSARSKQTNERPFMHLVALPHIKNERVLELGSFSVPINIGKKTKNISALVQNSATGNWLLAGDFGLRIHN